MTEGFVRDGRNGTACAESWNGVDKPDKLYWDTDEHGVVEKQGDDDGEDAAGWAGVITSGEDGVRRIWIQASFPWVNPRLAPIPFPPSSEIKPPEDVPETKSDPQNELRQHILSTLDGNLDHDPNTTCIGQDTYQNVRR